MNRNLWIVGSFVFFCSCGFSELFSTVGNIHDGCSGVLKEHPEMLELAISLSCSYDNKCDSYLAFGGWVEKNPKAPKECYEKYEYKYVSKKTKEYVHMNSTLYNVLDSDEHVRFSLFDKNNVEKSYDIDLSEIIHSYTFKGDSVEIKMPSEGFTNILLDCPYCTYNKERIYDNLCQGYFACNYQSSEMSTVMIGTDSTWGNSYIFHQYLSNQSSMNTDSIKVYGEIVFR